MKRAICRQYALVACSFLFVTWLPASAAERIGDWIANFQATYIWQKKNAFDALYSGPNSLTTESEQSYSLTATAFLGIRPWRNGELYFNPEVAQGRALSDLTGLGGLTNGEMARTSGATLKLYRARLYLRQIWNLGGDSETIEAGPDQLQVEVDKHRFVVTLGNLSLLDVFDANHRAHDPRTQFLNWALITYGAYDFAADARGYTWAAIAELYEDAWAFRIGRAMLPLEPNGLELDSRIFKHFGDQFEIERDYEWNAQPGAVRMLIYRDRAAMTLYRDALSLAAATGTTPDVNAARYHEQNKTGVGLSLEQAFNTSDGGFARFMWADGKTETESYATIDRSIATGVTIGGSHWRRTNDAIGLAYAWDFISQDNRQYLSAGGLDFFIGDGKLNYASERIVEAYYDAQLSQHFWLTADLQYVTNPAYNRDRGPATITAIRMHMEF